MGDLQHGEAIADMEIDELQKNIAHKKLTVELLKNQILDTEIKLIIRNSPEVALEEKGLGGREITNEVTSKSKSSTLANLENVEDEHVERLNHQVNELQIKLRLLESKEKKILNQL